MANFIVGLTGGIGSGKSAASHYFEEKGVPVIDADIVAREVVAPGSPGLEKIRQTFGDSVILQDGNLNRPALRELVFTDSDKRAALEAILHPLIKNRTSMLLKEAKGPYAIYSAPLLIESQGHKGVNRVLVVDVPESLQLQRASQRDGQTAEQIKGIMHAQVSRDERLRHADDILDNSKDLQTLAQQVDKLHQTYLTLSQSTVEQ